ncbi:MAG TPA: prepilin-type N-terminal cleavage/methylation domain-containing protein [Terriglobales bacterium]|nr:prepilin-type N-terminal cleavage/methylation domain-containing protein [Terriglobales bacterium]
MRNEKGFSLVELLIVVAIILIIAGIAIPNMLRARMAANESSAVAGMRTIFAAEMAYDAQAWTNPNAIGFSNLLKDLGNTTCNPPTMISACLLDDSMANAATISKSGYLFTYTPKNPGGGKNTDFDLNADPVTRGQSGERSFYTNTTGVIRYNPTAAAGPTDPAIQ